ncbi:redoxin domain-containing protein [Bythopirellula polymerisocia]|uniref:Thiol-disulfide oxidoreductase n=1 Tax=Bythopirellula polymerisocia TaxID=2528003 RepID=A0A5C6CXR4_9BACT|nr:redoxin domain-containing protein [Bythopirellula polymerisocia]TWU27826.1 thiol-disulfide oxidoreductase [Bythopirellula polymerisocia]
MTRCTYLAHWLVLAILLFANPPSSIALEVETLKIGAAAPDFELPGVDGKTYSLSDFADAKLLMVIFTCNHCPTAQAYEARIKQLNDQYQDRGVALVAISPNDPLAVRLDELGYSDLNDSFEDMKTRAQDEGFEFPYLYDGETQETSRAYGVRATPHVYLFDAERKLRYVGRIDDNDVKPPASHDARNALEELLSGKEVTVPTTRVFGCSTKWSDKRESAQESLAQWNQEEAELKTITPEELHTRLTQKSDKYRLVNVWATWCAPCVGELEELVTMHRMYRKRPFELITVSADELSNAKAAEKVLDEKHCSATNYLLDAQTRDDLFEAVDPAWQGALPYTVLIDPDGTVVHRIHDSFDAAKLKRVIVEHLGRTYAEQN